MKTMGALKLAALGALVLAGPAMAVTPFASFIPVGTDRNVRYQQTGTNDGSFFTITSPSATTAGPAKVLFSFLDPVLSGLGVLQASFFNSAFAVDNPALSVGGLLVQNIDSGTLAFTYTGAAPLVVGSNVYTTGANLLSVTFTNGNIVGTNLGTAGSALVSTPEGTIVYTSDFLTFDPTTAKDFALALTSLTPVFTRLNPNSSIASFDALAAGVFSNEVGATVPEPESWALLITGFVLIGARARYRRVSVVSA